MRYIVACADEYLAITGQGIKTIKITKSAWIWPFQKCQRFSIQPQDYSMSLQAMTREKLQFLLPVVFTVGPEVTERVAQAAGLLSDDAATAVKTRNDSPNGLNTKDHRDSLMKYAMLLADGEGDKKGGAPNNHIANIVKGIIEGETRVLVSSMTMEEIFTEREHFKQNIFTNIQSELDQFGLKIYNANVKELRDAPGSNYFESLSRKAHEGAINQARIDVAEAQRLGNVGEAQRQGEQNREIAKINAETAVQKTERDSERARAEATLATRKTVFNRDVDIARIEATRATEAKDEELRKNVEVKRAETELERMRASDVVKATITREAKQQAADAKNYEEKARADAAFYSEQKDADIKAYQRKIKADADANAAKVKAEADAAAANKNTDAHAYQIQIAADADASARNKGTDAEAYKRRIAADANAVALSKEADAHAYRTKIDTELTFVSASKRAEAQAYKTQVDAEALYKEADAQAYRRKVQAEADAAGINAMASAYSNLSQAFGGPAGLIQYLMIEKGTYVDLAKANADAVRGMNPKMTIWNTGAQAGSEGENAQMGGMNSIRNMYQMLPPLMSTINEQTGIVLPEWQFGKLAGQISDKEVNGTPIHGMGKGVNGTNGIK